MKERLQKIFNSWFGAILYILLGVFVLLILVQTIRIELYILTIVGVLVLYLLRRQDWLPYIFGGVVLALIAHFALGVVLSTKFPLVAVVSGSMDHGVNEYGYPCGKQVSNYQNTFDNWWQLCSPTYQDFNITKQQFEQFPLHDGLEIGDMPVVEKDNAYKVGEIIVYDAGQAAPIIHRAVKINGDGTYQTKGDHNLTQNPYEYSVKAGQIAGKVVFVIPKLGYLRVLVTRIFGV